MRQRNIGNRANLTKWQDDFHACMVEQYPALERGESSSKTGRSGLTHPDWMENLKLAAALQEDLLTEYPTLMRPILLRNSRYNQHAPTGSLLLEVGAAGNSPEEAVLAGRLFAERMVAVLEARSK